MVSPRKGADLVYENVVKQFPGKGGEPVTALDGVSFEIRQGELFCLLGPSGCGKTTLMRCTAGLETLTSGRILYGGVNFAEIPPHRRNIGMVFQKFALFPHMTVFENVAYGLRVRKTPEAEIRRRVTEAMELVGLPEILKRDQGPTALSGGQQQRVAIARALVYDPEILLLDEPLANLDAKLRLREMSMMERKTVQDRTPSIELESIETWVFDLDGTLVEAMPLQHVIAEVARLSGRPFEELFREYRTQFQGLDAMRAYHRSLVPQDQAEEVDALYAAWQASHAKPELLEGARELLSLLKRQGKRLILWSKGTPAQQEEKTRRVGVYDFFDARLVSHEKGRHEAVERWLVPAVKGPWAMVGDSYEQDVLPALDHAAVVYWIHGGWANRIAGPKTRAAHPKMRRIGHIRELLMELERVGRD
jgi:haloacid dehalogenase superfamily, subfamily IA, variant 1 with third motif having Dx(3-4)D or Dx(3-4)E